MTATSLAFSCACGEVSGDLDLTETAPLRVVCYCRDCQAYLRHLGQSADAGPAGGTEIVQTVPARVTFRSGRDKLAALRMTPKGVHRYYAACCGVPIANSSPTPALPFCGVIGARLGDAAAREKTLGPIRFAAFVKSAAGPVPKLPGLLRHGLATLRLVVPAAVWKDTQTPFFHGGEPICEQPLLADEARAAAYG